MLEELPADARLASPCVGVCRLDAETGWCLGCGRSAGDLAVWRDTDDASRDRIWRELPDRQSRLGLRFRLLPWAAAPLLSRLAEMTAQPGTAWTVGAYGAVGELLAFPGEFLSAEVDTTGLAVRTRGGRMRLGAHPGLRAFALVDEAGEAKRIVLTLHRSRFPRPEHGVAELGADDDAVDSAASVQSLFDLGLGLRSIRFCVRTGDAQLLRALRAYAGQPLLLPGSALIPILLEASPDRVLITPLGRLEIEGPILRDGHEGPHTHLLPELLARNRELEPGFELPEAYAPCASFYPAGRSGSAAKRRRAAQPLLHGAAIPGDELDDATLVNG